jgi:peroxiredoxin
MLGIGCLIGVGIGYLLFGRTGEESAANRQPREAADGPAVQSLDPAGPLDTPTPVPTIMVEIGSTADPRPTRTPEPERATEIPVRPQEGAFPPAFTLPSLEGDSIALADYRGQPILLNFWATWCPPCVEEMPAIQAAYESHAREGLVVLAVNSGETADVVEDFQLDAGFTFPILLDSDDRVSEDYNIEYLPTSFFVDVEGIIRVKVEEGMSESDLRRNLEEILP